MIVLAVDPGLTGACAVLDHNGLRAVFDLPRMPIPNAGPKAKVQDKLDARALVRLLRTNCPAGEPVKAVLEGVSVIGAEYGHSSQSQGSLLRMLGSLEAVLECLGWAPEYAHPQSWKKYFGLVNPKWSDAERKRESLKCARKLYPACADLKLAKHHNRGEAILIAHWWRKTQS